MCVVFGNAVLSRVETTQLAVVLLDYYVCYGHHEIGRETFEALTVKSKTHRSCR
jgi:hypothetical protein